MLQHDGDGNFQSQESKPHPNAVPGTSSKGQVRIRVYGVFVFLTEPGQWHGWEKRNESGKTSKSYISVLLIQRCLAGALQRLVWFFAKVSQRTPAFECCVRALSRTGWDPTWVFDFNSVHPDWQKLEARWKSRQHALPKWLVFSIISCV